VEWFLDKKGPIPKYLGGPKESHTRRWTDKREEERWTVAPSFIEDYNEQL
jgi:hypothetical protein